MNNQVIKSKLKRIIPKNHFVDVVIKDTLVLNKYPCCIVVNSSGPPGVHWFSIYGKSKNSLYFFDSLGRHPSYYNLGLKFKVDSKYRLQCLNSDVCGQYSIYYLYLKSHGINNVLSRFSKNCKKNDAIVTKFVRRL